jgi:glycerol-3-phosphate dehydrogenase
MGRCQAGFCGPKTIEILARETNRAPEDICKNRPGSNMLKKEEKGAANDRA